MKPCPFCGDTNLHETSNGDGFCFVECDTCGTSGPVHETMDGARAEWNCRK